MQTLLDYLLEKINIWVVVLGGFLLVLSFSLAYYFIPIYLPDSRLVYSNSGTVTDPIDFFYFSFVTASTLGYGDIMPTKWLKLLACAEVMFGLVWAGFTVNFLIGLPSRKSRQAIRACKGWWVECAEIPCLDSSKSLVFYSFTNMYRSGTHLTKAGNNFNPGGPMHDSHYNGKIISLDFPTLYSHYENDPMSTEYTEGVFKIKMEENCKGKYFMYSGFCYDKKFGGRDRLTGKRFTNKKYIKKANRNSLTIDDKINIIRENFDPDYLIKTKQPTTEPNTA